MFAMVNLGAILALLLVVVIGVVVLLSIAALAGSWTAATRGRKAGAFFLGLFSGIVTLLLVGWMLLLLQSPEGVTLGVAPVLGALGAFVAARAIASGGERTQEIHHSPRPFEDRNAQQGMNPHAARLPGPDAHERR